MKSTKPQTENSVKLVDGVPFPTHWNDIAILLWLYREAPTLQKNPKCVVNGQEITYVGGSRFDYAKTLAKILFPKAFEWHPWAEEVVRASCENSWLCVSGCGTSGKSTAIGLDAFLYYICAPLDTAVIVASTTLDSSKKRIWKEISRFYLAFSKFVGGYKEATIGSSPRPYISPYRKDEPTKRDEAHGMYVTALQKKAEVEQEMDFVKGFHVRRIMLVADELDSIREHGAPLVQVFIDNLSSGVSEAKFVGLGNDPSLFNELGELMQREKGKPLTLADKEWTSIHGVKCLRLDAWDSPNICDNNKWTGLIRQEDIDRIVQWKGENSPSVWIQLHGLHPPEGIEDTVLSEATLIRFKCFEGVTWESGFTSYGCLDPAFGGDDCVIRRFDYGLALDSTDKNKGILPPSSTVQRRIKFYEPKVLRIEADKEGEPIEYKIATQTMQFCKANGIAPLNFILDATGTGRGVAAVLQREWSPAINVCEFGGLPSTMPVSDENPIPAKDEYDRKVTELCFSFREFVHAGMVRNLDQQTAREACSRHFEIKNRKTCIETKTDMKNRGLSSPDNFDNAVLAVELLRRRGVNASVATKAKVKANKDFERFLIENDLDSREDILYQPVEADMI